MLQFKELENRSVNDLQQVLKDSRQKLQELRFKVASKQLKNIREIRSVRLTIAHILTILQRRRAAAPDQGTSPADATTKHQSL
ncbi:MAG: 50S ribosomal protein L29 [Candidatus Buchananbacteria bacterium RIFCSPLOWO2_01_FULL_56_15]|uniref:Large ribosomal subunit protein uL29 n=2 Tax=Candidatus Buchananiibacteriota TaxID=1817903 RepID=A0A1G1YJC2_9BACT|nr:MAG: 50S ribosomal protein L29 [Candidatus Buchananbacteria bacterium RIFCSPHIGHO2_02_FULL_56_16]OGY54894.1 MAG: 50S ribosomal protein L29 [Candidatus Buchananbacteria bacterium RIFCSPLOWO2_01_FULL_56_15]